MKKSIIISIVAVLLASSLCTNAYATPYIGMSERNNYLFDSEMQREAIGKGISYSEVISEKESDRLYNERIIRNKTYGISLWNVSYEGRYVSSPIKLIKQNNNDNCGPTSALQALYGSNNQSKVKGNTDSKKINQLAAEAGTDSSGTMVYRLTGTLNTYANLKYTYSCASNMTQSKFKQHINNSLFYNTAPILHAKTEKISYYEGRVSGHYIAIQQLDLFTDTLRVYDCNNNNDFYGIHDITISEAYDSLVGSRYLIHLNY